MRMWYLFPFIPCIKYPSNKGKEGETPRLNKLGTGCVGKNERDVPRAKSKNNSRDLIRLYSQRKQEKGFSYSPDSLCNMN